MQVVAGGRRVVAAARKTVFWKYRYEFTCHVFHPKSTALFTPPFTALVAAWISGLNRNRTAGLLAASAAEVAGLGPATPWHTWHPPIPPSYRGGVVGDP